MSTRMRGVTTTEGQAMSPRLSVKQCEALQAVADGRVTYGDPYPQALARRVEAARRRAAAGETVAVGFSGDRRPVTTRPAALAVPDFLVDGRQVYGAEHSTYSSLSERDLIYAAMNEDGDTRLVVLTDAGREAAAKPRTEQDESTPVAVGSGRDEETS